MTWAVLFLFVAFFWANCPCCGGCTYFTDTFAVDNLATDYTVNAGSWAVTGGKLDTSSDNAQIIGNTEATLTHGHFQVDITNSANTDQIEIIGGYVDASNYFFALLSYGFTNGTVQIYKKVAGVDTAIGPPDTVAGLDASDTRTFTLCWDDEKVTIDCFNTGRSSASFVSSGTKAGVGTRNIFGTVHFDNWLLRKTDVDTSTCPACATICSNCINGIPAKELQVVIAGIVSSGSCGAPCANLNGTYTLTYVGSDTSLGACGAGGGPCLYRYDLPTDYCNIGYLEAKFVTGGDVEVSWVTYTALGGCGASTGLWRGASGSTPVDCENISGLSCARVNDAAGCVLTGSTATVTSL